MFGNNKKIGELERRILDLSRENQSLRESLAAAERQRDESAQRCAGTEQRNQELQKLFASLRSYRSSLVESQQTLAELANNLLEERKESVEAGALASASRDSVHSISRDLNHLASNSRSAMEKVTSLRTSDSLTDNESYFFAELKRLKLIIDKLQAGEELFIILDEILKGTNSMDKQKGSFALIKQFMALEADGIIATHDLLLGTLIDLFPENIRNFRFEADITDNELTFSYRLRPGVAQNMNACFLMKKMGIAVTD